MSTIMERSTVAVFENWIGNTKSKNTELAYSRIIKQFFEILFDKELKDLEYEDMLKISPLLIDIHYKKYLKQRNVKDSTIIGNIKVVKSFFKQLKANRIWSDLDYHYIIESALNFEGLHDDSGTTQRMTRRQMDEFQEWLENERFTGVHEHLGKKYSLLSEMLWITASRITAILNIKWIDFVYEEDSRGVFGYTLYVEDKGNKENRKSISTEMFERLKEEFYAGKDNAKVFAGLSQQGFRQSLKMFSEFQNKNLTPHSIKKGSVTEVYYITHDIELTMRHADHEDIKTTLGYIDLDNDRINTGSYILSNKNIDLRSIEQLSHEQLLGIIQDRKDFLMGIFHMAVQKGLLKEEDVNNVKYQV